ncbi:MAG: S-ribosylhomocysteine lyase [Clostridiales bacterium]|nr:S-ribosylhomocysteine lyase [Clostridiales bacterium]
MNVTSFTIDHDKLLRGIYVSRKDSIGKETITTFDVRIKRPNTEPPVEISAIHTLEHLMAVYLRSEESGIAEDVIYVGPMGCRTGMYVIFKGDLTSEQILPYITKTFEYVRDFTGTVPATTSAECGNYLDHNLTFAKYEADKYLREVLYNITPENLNYPE